MIEPVILGGFKALLHTIFGALRFNKRIFYFYLQMRIFHGYPWGRIAITWTKPTIRLIAFDSLHKDHNFFWWSPIACSLLNDDLYAYGQSCMLIILVILMALTKVGVRRPEFVLPKYTQLLFEIVIFPSYPDPTPEWTAHPILGTPIHYLCGLDLMARKVDDYRIFRGLCSNFKPQLWLRMGPPRLDRSFQFVVDRKEI